MYGSKVIYKYKNNGYNIVLDVNSGSVHVVDDVVYDVIPMVEESLGWKAQAVMVRDLVAIGLNRILSYNEDI